MILRSSTLMKQDNRRLQKKRGAGSGSRRKNSFWIVNLIKFVVCFVLLLGLGIIWRLIGEIEKEGNNNLQLLKGNEKESRDARDKKYKKDESTEVGGLEFWTSLAVKLAKLPHPSEILKELQNNDPFGVRTFEKALIDRETSLGRTLQHSELVELFSCPERSKQVTFPDMRDSKKAIDFRAEKKGSFLFFQHLRKAGGTHFCSLAHKNLPKTAIAQYYCMSDYRWSGFKNAGYLKNWPNNEISTRMLASGHRIIGNEWQNFDHKRFFDLPAVFSTSFRKPLDRALSQFRFECIEDRGCKIKNVGEWWKIQKHLHNVYIQTFADVHFHAIKDLGNRATHVSKSIETISRFNLVLAMEWLTYAGPQITDILGFQDTSELTKRVRPHIESFKRNDGQEQNLGGAASISKASWVPEEYLTKEQYKDMSEDLALDEILTDVARRMFLERLVCTDHNER